MQTPANAPSPELIANRWQFLEHRADACSVVSRRMELLYLNSAARTLAPPQWFGQRCWQVFPVADQACAFRCPVIKAVATSDEISYCEETVYPEGQPPILLSVAVIPLQGEDDLNALLLMRPKPKGQSDELVREQIMDEARRLQDQCVSQMLRPSSTT